MSQWVCLEERVDWDAIGSDAVGPAETLGPQLGRDLRSGRGPFGVERC